MKNMMDAINCTPTSNFTQIPNEILRNPNLSFKAKGILCALLSNRDGWVSYQSGLEKCGKDGRDSILSGLSELKKQGYFWSVKYVDKKTKRTKGSFWAYTAEPFGFNMSLHIEKMEENNEEIWAKSLSELEECYNKWVTEKPQTEKPFMENPLTENPHLIIPSINNTNLNKHHLKNSRDVPSEQSHPLSGNSGFDLGDNPSKNTHSKPSKLSRVERTAIRVLGHWNKANQKHRQENNLAKSKERQPSKGNLKHIKDRLNDGATYRECIDVIDNQYLNDFLWQKNNFTPKTLFKEDLFPGYLENKHDPKQYNNSNGTKGRTNAAGLTGMKFDRVDMVLPSFDS